MMRILSLSAAIGLTLLSVSTSLHGQGATASVDPRSAALVERARAARAAGNLSGANDLLETALVVDPRNRAAVTAMAEIARAQNLPGKAIRLYREALAQAPNDMAALRGQGEAMVQKGAVVRARENLAKIRELCGTADCPDAPVLAAAIAKGPPVVSATTQVARQDSPAGAAPN